MGHLLVLLRDLALRRLGNGFLVVDLSKLLLQLHEGARVLLRQHAHRVLRWPPGLVEIAWRKGLPQRVLALLLLAQLLHAHLHLLHGVELRVGVRRDLTRRERD